MTVTDELSPSDDPPGVARIWGELDDGRNLEDVLAEESAPASEKPEQH